MDIDLSLHSRFSDRMVDAAYLPILSAGGGRPRIPSAALRTVRAVLPAIGETQETSTHGVHTVDCRGRLLYMAHGWPTPLPPPPAPLAYCGRKQTLVTI